MSGRNPLVLLEISIGGNDMPRKIAMAIMALSLGGCFILTSLPVWAQQNQQQQQNKGKGQTGGGGNAGAPHGGVRTATPGATHTATPSATRKVTTSTTATRKVSTPTTATHKVNTTTTATRKVTTPTTATRKVSTTTTATRKVTTPTTATRKVNTRTTATRKVSTTTTATRKVTTPTTAARKVTPGAAPKIVSPSGEKAHVVTAGKLRGMPASGAGQATVLGHNYSVWRSGYRVRHGNGWLTFVALRTLTSIAIGSRHYYPYAYITAPQPYCTGLTEDGCQLMWQDVETIEGDIVSQCVAYCPWQ
jgi:hypothetical protein